MAKYYYKLFTLPSFIQGLIALSLGVREVQGNDQVWWMIRPNEGD